MPLKPRDVFLGKIVPYFAVAALDLAIVVSVGVGLFGVPFRGSAAVFALGALLFLFVTLGIGVLISIISQNQGHAFQLAVMTLLPPAHLLQRDLPRRDAQSGADRGALAALCVPGPAGCRRRDAGHDEIPRL